MNLQSFGYESANSIAASLMNRESLENLSKALSAGSGVNAASFTGGRALSVENLDQTLVNLLWTQEDAVLFKNLKKQTSTSPVRMWNEQSGAGSSDGAWVGEGAESQEADPTIARKYTTAKYLQTLRKVTVQAQLTDMIEDPVAVQENAGTLWLIEQIEKALIYGDSSVVTEQPDGLITLLPSTQIIDLRGETAASATFETQMREATRNIRQNYGRADLLLASTRAIADVQDLISDRLKFMPQLGIGVPGASVMTQYPTPFGSPQFRDDIFIQEGGAPVASGLTTLRPDAPTLTSATPVAPTVAGSKFATGDAGEYYYVIVAVNAYGDSVASAAGHATVAAGGAIDLVITEGASSCTGFKIYRSKIGAGSATDVRFMKQIANTGSPVTYRDLNEDLPGCSDVFVLTTDPLYNAIEWAQFLPMMKFDLYPANAAIYPFLMMVFGSLALKKPKQHVRIKNVAPSDLGWF